MKSKRKVLFYDDFTDIVLDPTKWYIETNTESEMNHEKRYTYMPGNITIEDSNLVLTARRECYKGGTYTSASINTGKMFSFCYGRLEMRAKLPYGEGLWPALWLMGDDYFDHRDQDAWPRCGDRRDAVYWHRWREGPQCAGWIRYPGPVCVSSE